MNVNETSPTTDHDHDTRFHERGSIGASPPEAPKISRLRPTPRPNPRIRGRIQPRESNRPRRRRPADMAYEVSEPIKSLSCGGTQMWVGGRQNLRQDLGTPRQEEGGPRETPHGNEVMLVCWGQGRGSVFCAYSAGGPSDIVAGEQRPATRRLRM